MKLNTSDLKQAIAKSLIIHHDHIQLVSDEYVSYSKEQLATIQLTVDRIFEIIDLVGLLIKNKQLHFKWENNEPTPIINASPIGKKLYNLLINDSASLMKQMLNGLTTHPFLDLFISSVHEIEFTAEQLKTKDRSLFDNLNKFIDNLRAKAKQRSKGKSPYTIVKDHRDRVNNNYRALCDYVARLRKSYPVLHVIELELAYHPPKGAQLISDNSFIMSPFINTYTEVKQHRIAFLKQLKHPKYFNQCDHLVGFAWHLNYTQQKGFFYNWLLLFEDYTEYSTTIHEAIVHLWHKVTQQLGIHYYQLINLTSKNKKQRSKEQLNQNEQMLELALLSLTQVDEYFYYKPPSKDRIFGKGQLRTAYQLKYSPKKTVSSLW